MKTEILAEEELGWVDDFWKRAGEHIFARTEDGVLILPPNRVYRINETAAALVDYLKRGGSMARLQFPSAQAKRDTALFFGDVAALYRLDEPINGTVERVSYDFSFTQLPVLGELALTYRCNNACRFCYAACGDRGYQAAARRPERRTEEYKRIIDIFADQAKIPFFSFTGGEPLLRDDLEELISYAASRKLITNLVTNGTLMDAKRARRLKKAGLQSAQVSIEAPTAEVHDDLVGRFGAFSETLRGIYSLMDAGIPTQTNTTLTQRNVFQGESMVPFLKDLGIRRFAMNLFIPTRPGADAEELFIPYEEIGPVVDRIAKTAREEGLTFYWYSPTPFCSYNPIARGLGNKSCAAADGLVSVAPDGSLLPCSSWDESLGNLFETPFLDLWFSPSGKYYKEKFFAPPECQTCGSFTACQGACPLYWRYVGEKHTRRPQP